MLILKIDPFPELTTDRLKMRKMKQSDIAAIGVLRSHPKMLKFLNRDAPNSDAIQKWLNTTLESEKNNELISWACCTLESNEFVGTICLWNIEHENYRAEIGYSVLPDHQGKGYMKEMMKAVLKFGFEEMKLHTIVGYVNPKNLASVHLLESNLFIKEGLLKECTHYKGQFFDLALYRLTSPIAHIPN